MRDLAERLQAHGFSLSAGVISNILRKTLGIGRRSIAKNVPLGSSELRNEQFEKLAELRRLYESRDWPVVSVDTKKKELIGRFARSGQAWSDGTLRAYDHDFGSYGNEDKAIPYGVYDTVANEAFVYLATGSDTGELAADALRRWWIRMGRQRYQEAGGLLVLADCGGSNGYRVTLYRERLQQLARRLELPIRVAHLPPYCSKYNPIDHRLFRHLSRAIRGRLVESLTWLQLLFSRVTTRSGLKVVCDLARISYEAGIKASQAIRGNEPTLRGENLGQFNYTLQP